MFSKNISYFNTCIGKDLNYNRISFVVHDILKLWNWLAIWIYEITPRELSLHICVLTKYFIIWLCPSLKSIVLFQISLNQKSDNLAYSILMIRAMFYTRISKCKTLQFFFLFNFDHCWLQAISKALKFIQD